MRQRTKLTILQHPREQRHPVGTARIAQLGLREVSTHVGVQHERAAILPPPAALLYPTPHARGISVARREPPEHLIVIDGTWSQAHVIYRENPWLQALPSYVVSASAPDRYRVRGEPDPGGLATIEAIVQALRIIEPHTPGLEGLLDAFDALVGDQVAAIERHRAGARQRQPRQRPRESRAVPPALTRDWDRVVVVHGESTGTPRNPEIAPRQLVHWTATQPYSGRTFSALVASVAETLTPNHRRHLALTPALMDPAGTLAELRLRWEDWLPAAPVFAAWTPTDLELLASLTPETNTPPILLKAAWCNLRRAGRGDLADILRTEGREAIPVAPGRAGRRLAEAVAMAEYLRATSSPAAAGYSP